MITIKDLFKVKATKSTELNQHYFIILNNGMHKLMTESMVAGPQWHMGSGKLNKHRIILDEDNGEEGWN